LFTAERAQPTGAFGNVTHLASASSANVDLPSWISADRCVIYFSSDRFGATYEIWRVASNGTGLTRMTNFGQDAQHPVVSGDGSRFGTWLDVFSQRRLILSR
jgi:Tol biopolymer transport system component